MNCRDLSDATSQPHLLDITKGHSWVGNRQIGEGQVALAQSPSLVSSHPTSLADRLFPDAADDRRMAPRVAVAYEALPAATDYEAVRHDVERQLPLRNLHWVRRNAANRSIRTVNDLAVDIRSSREFPAPTSQGGASLLERPYLNLLFVVCDVRRGHHPPFSNLRHADQLCLRIADRTTKRTARRFGRRYENGSTASFTDNTRNGSSST